MKTEKDIMHKFDSLYAKMATSTDVSDMQLFGSTFRKAMEWIAAYKPEKAEELICMLCAIEWDNYLTKAEAEQIVEAMEPKPVWSYDEFVRALDSLGLPCEESPYYNSYAMWVAASMKYSDSAKSIAKILGRDSEEDVDKMEMVNVCYMLAHDILKDKDGVFNVRKYFGK